MAEKKSPASKPAPAVKHKSKKPIKKGSNSGASLEQRISVKNSCGMLARSCATTFKLIEEMPLKYEGEVLRFPKDIVIPFDEVTREIKSNELSELRKIERALQKHSKDLEYIWKQVRPQRPVEDKKKPFDKRKVNPSNPFQKENRVNQPKMATQSKPPIQTTRTRQQLTPAVKA